LQTPIVYTKVILRWKVLEFVKGKPKGTNLAIMGNPINMYAVNGSKRQSISICITNETKSKLSEQYSKQKTNYV